MQGISDMGFPSRDRYYERHCLALPSEVPRGYFAFEVSRGGLEQALRTLAEAHNKTCEPSKEGFGHPFDILREDYESARARIGRRLTGQRFNELRAISKGIEVMVNEHLAPLLDGLEQQGYDLSQDRTRERFSAVSGNAEYAVSVDLCFEGGLFRYNPEGPRYLLVGASFNWMENGIRVNPLRRVDIDSFFFRETDGSTYPVRDCLNFTLLTALLKGESIYQAMEPCSKHPAIIHNDVDPQLGLYAFPLKGDIEEMLGFYQHFCQHLISTVGESQKDNVQDLAFNLCMLEACCAGTIKHVIKDGVICDDAVKLMKSAGVYLKKAIKGNVLSEGTIDGKNQDEMTGLRNRFRESLYASYKNIVLR